jgi:branched-chain amino acid transport system substrate-binding protein
MQPISTSCTDHAGARTAAVHTWDGKKWQVQKDRYVADQQIIKPMISASAEKYAQEKKLTKRDCSKE